MRRPMFLCNGSVVLGVPVVVWPGWTEALTIIKADTVLRWRRLGVSTGLEVSITWSLARRTPQNRGRDPPADLGDGPREFSLGCTTHSRRIAETRNCRLASYRLAVHAGVAWRPPVTDMADIRTEPSY